MKSNRLKIVLLMTLFIGIIVHINAQTIAHWNFNESQGLYPSHVIDDASNNNYPMVIGKSGSIVSGVIGNALDLTTVMQFEIPETDDPKAQFFGLGPALSIPKGKTSIPMNWENANFGALMTLGETHLRKNVQFANATDTKLNLGDFDWTIEFWYQPTKTLTDKGVIFEIGTGPLREQCAITSLSVLPNENSFELINTTTNSLQIITSKYVDIAHNKWHHYAFVYDSGKNDLTHYVDGKKVSKTPIAIQQLAPGEEAYFTVGRNGFWKNPLPGIIDELEFYEGIKYTNKFKLPSIIKTDESSLSYNSNLPLLFAKNNSDVFNLGSRKHVFLDDVFLQSKDDEVKFIVNPPKHMERVIGDIEGEFRKHLTVLEDEEGNIRIYNSVEDDQLAVRISKDGINFEIPKIIDNGKGNPNVVILERNGGMGNPFIDINGTKEERYKYLANYQRRGVYLYTSPDGYKWRRSKTATLPFRPGSQSCTFYDDQTQEYVSYHRTDMLETKGGSTLRGSVLVQLKDLSQPVNYQQLTKDDIDKARKTYKLREPQPWFMDNGPLTPGGFSLEFPLKFLPNEQDPVGTDIYVTKAQKYQWAPDTYVAFPIMYFHYNDDGPDIRITLMDKKRLRGEGPLETQLSVSRDGLNWKRYPRPAYVGIGKYQGRDIHTAYLAHGMIRRGDEIWQYYFGETQYHSAYTREPEGRGVYRLVQRLDGFVSMDSPYGKEVTAITKPFNFDGNSLHVNIDTDAAGYTQIGFIDEYGNPIEGFSVDDGVYINGDFVDSKVEWLNKGTDVSSLAGQTVQLVFKMRGSKVYAFKFNND